MEREGELINYVIKILIMSLDGGKLDVLACWMDDIFVVLVGSGVFH